MSTLGDKLMAKANCQSVACFVPDYMADFYRQQTTWPVNDAGQLEGDDLLLIDARLKADSLPADWSKMMPGASCSVRDDSGEVACARITQSDVRQIAAQAKDVHISPATLLAAAQSLPSVPNIVATCWNYTWELVLTNAKQITADFRELGRHGIEGTIEEPSGLRGSRKDIYLAPGSVVHPFVVLDAEQGPIYIDEGAVLQPFTRVVGPCYIGPQSVLLGTKCHAGNTFGPQCRIGGEVEESIIQGHSNKYHDGFLGHAYVGEWVNLGAMTSNSDLKNDYTEVTMTLDGRHSIPTGSTKCGAVIGDHAKTSIGTVLNTGAYLGAMAVAVSDGSLLPKFMPSFTWYLGGTITLGTGKERLFGTARTVVGRRGRKWTAAEDAMWNHIYDITAADRDAAIARNQRRQGLR
jgi:UDP-N-acetylglucosamine diphosphorylase/glucosamine-1-phosphate N-acetyltransferase